MKKILIMGKSGVGKTTLAKELAKLLGAVHFNADEIRSEINRDLDFSPMARVEQARRMGILCDIVTRSGGYAIADFICPTEQTRDAFGDAFVVWVHRKGNEKYEDTDKMFQMPLDVDVEVTDMGTPLYWANQIKNQLLPIFQPTAQTALFVGRYQPVHDAHVALFEEGIRRVGQICIAVREMPISDKNPFTFEEVEQNIRIAMKEHEGSYTIIKLPNISNVFYGRDVGYKIEMIDLPQEFKDISATKIREEMNI